MLDPKAQTLWLRAAERAARRDRALAHVGFYAGLRIGEWSPLNVDDVRMSARKGHPVVRYGRGAAAGRFRSTPYTARRSKAGWRSESNWPGAKENLASS